MASVRALVDDVEALVVRCARGDLTDRLRATRTRLADPRVRVVVVGEFKAGKSQLVNALVNSPVCPVDDDAATAVPTEVFHAAAPSAHLVIEAAGQEHREEVDLASLARYVVEQSSRPGRRAGRHATAGAPGEAAALRRAEVALPRDVLATGLVLVDTPGTGGLNSAHTLATLEAVSLAHAVLLVTDAAQELTAHEMAFAGQVAALCPTLACVVTKTDLYPAWRRIVEADHAHLQRAEVAPLRGAPLFPTSATVRLAAVAAQDATLSGESGVPALLRWLREDVVGADERLRHRSVAHDLQAVVENVELGVRPELQALRDPAGAQESMARLDAAKSAADALRASTARWQQTLSDGTTDLVSDLEHDLRERIRMIQHDADAALEDVDPAKVWDQFATWLSGRVATAVSENFLWADERARALAAQVADHFAQAGSAVLPDLPASSAEGALAVISPLGALDAGPGGPVGRALTGLRGSYSGVVMVGLLSSVAGMALINPLSVGAGLLLGGKTLRDDAQLRLHRRRGEAKAAVRRHLDEVVFQVSKASRDRLRTSQRATRDHFAGVAEQLQRSLAASQQAAAKAVSAGDADRERRIAELEALLADVAALRSRVQGLAAAGRAAPQQSGRPAQQSAQQSAQPVAAGQRSGAG